MTSKRDSARYDRLQRIGCIACRKEGRHSQIDVHHLVDRGTRKLSGGNGASLPLCPHHHRNQPPDGMRPSQAYQIYGPTLRAHKREFLERYGTERQLLAEVDALVERIELPAGHSQGDIQQ